MPNFSTFIPGRTPLRRKFRVVCLAAVIAANCLGLGCRKKDDVNLSGAGSTPDPNSSANSTAVQPKGISQIVALAALPKLDNGGKLVAAIHCDNEFASIEGVEAVWTLDGPHPPDSALWIIAIDPQTRTWLSTGEMAIVSPTGNEAIGTIYCPGDFALSDLPLAIPEKPRYATEWVWLFSIYDRKLDEQARAVTEKFRSALHVPPGAYVTVGQWLGSDSSLALSVPSPEINGTPADKSPILVDDASALAAARDEFAARKSVLDKGFVAAFANWAESAAKPGSEGAAALWHAAIDLRLLRGERFSGRNARFIFAAELSTATCEAIGSTIAHSVEIQSNQRFIAILSEYMTRSTIEPARVKAVVNSTETAQAWLASSFQDFFGDERSEANLNRLIEALTLWGDAMIDQAAYPRPTESVPSANFRNLGIAPSEAYFTALAIRLDHEKVLEEKFARHKASAVIPGRRPPVVACQLGLAEMRTLAAGHAIEVSALEDGSQTTYQVKKLMIPNYRELHAQLEQMEKEIKQRGEEGQKAWFRQVGGDNKVQAAAAIRLLMYDLRTFLTQSIAPTDKQREAAIDELTAALLRETPKPAQPYLRPFAAMLRYYSEQYVDYLGQSHVSQLLDALDNRSMRSAMALLQYARVMAVFPNRDADLDRALLLRSQAR